MPPPWIVLMGGVSAALHVGKLPPAIPVLQSELGISLVQAGFLLSLVQLAGMMLGLVIGLIADGFGLRRSMATGLGLLFVAGLAGGWARDPTSLLLLRAAEGMGFLLATVPGPGLMRRLVAPDRVTRMLGFWAAYMPIGTALALFVGPLVIAVIGWPWWWWLTAALSGLIGIWVLYQVPRDPPTDPGSGPDEPWRQRLVQTVSTAGPWLGAVSFAVYAAQWLAVIGFLPSLYAESGWGGVRGGLLTAVVAAVNISGNVGAGWLLSRGWAPRTLLWGGFGAMAAGRLSRVQRRHRRQPGGEVCRCAAVLHPRRLGSRHVVLARPTAGAERTDHLHDRRVAAAVVVRRPGLRAATRRVAGQPGRRMAADLGCHRRLLSGRCHARPTHRPEPGVARGRRAQLSQTRRSGRWSR